MIQDTTLILQFLQIQTQRLHLQLITCNIVLQCHAQFVLCLDVVYQPLRQFDILPHYLLTVFELEDFQILSQSQEPLLLAALLFTNLSLLMLKCSQCNTSIDSSTCIHHLLCFQRQRVTPAWSCKALSICEITIHHDHIAIHRHRCRCRQLRQSRRASRLYPFLSKFYAYLLLSKSLAVAFHQLKQFVNCHLALRLSLRHRRSGYNYQERHVPKCH